jgi:hypothetical protein
MIDQSTHRKCEQSFGEQCKAKGEGGVDACQGEVAFEMFEQ